MAAIPTNITLHRRSRTLEIEWDDQASHVLPCELLRVYSPSAEVRGHTPEQAVLVTGKRFVGISNIELVGNYAIRPTFDDGHDTGLYSWKLLRDLGENREAHWKDYLIRLKSASASREREDLATDAPRGEVVGEWKPVTIQDPGQ